jgi:hypothetical protein
VQGRPQEWPQPGRLCDKDVGNGDRSDNSGGDGRGNVHAAAIKLGLTRQTVNLWLNNDWVPLEWQHWIERDKLAWPPPCPDCWEAKK